MRGDTKEGGGREDTKGTLKKERGGRTLMNERGH